MQNLHYPTHDCLVPITKHNEQENKIMTLIKDRSRIIIIGAGISGLSAAYHLYKDGFNNITILEAKNRIGGRVYTVPYENGVLELGAQWIQGQGENPLWNFAVEHNLVDKTNPKTSGEGLGSYHTCNGTIVPQNVVKEVSDVIENANEKCCEYIEMDKICNSDVSLNVEDFLRSHFDKYLDKCGDSLEIKNIKEGLYKWNITFQCLDNACHSMQDLSALRWGEYDAYSGNTCVNLPNGYKEVATHLASYLPEDKILFNKEVVKIEWDRNHSAYPDKNSFHKNIYSSIPTDNDNKNTKNQIKLTCSDDSTYEADHVIITVSLGFLKANHIALFDPPLPQKKQQTISAMGFGTLNKIHLIFERPFWDDKTQGFQLIWLPHGEDTCCLQMPNYEYPWYMDITGFDVLPNHSNILLCWIGRRGGEIIEKLSDDEVGDGCVRLLHHFTGKSITKLTKIIRSSWYSDPLTRGSYSNRTTLLDEIKCHTEDLASPILHKTSEYPLLQFAGEATETTYFSTVHGAFISGKREAELLIKFYKPKKDSI
ncbi:hypothetical protein CHUAL_011210 [Chamberlinius hualienensis]